MTFKRTIVDKFVRNAREQNYQSRAAYKLLELQKRFNVIKPGDCVLDLGCSPGSWIQVASQSLGDVSRGGAVIGIDLTEFPVPANKLPLCDGRAVALRGDVTALLRGHRQFFDQHRSFLPQSALAALERPSPFDVVLSDLCHNTGGHSDGLLSSRLAMIAAKIALGFDFDGMPDSESERLSSSASASGSGRQGSGSLLDRIRASKVNTVRVGGGDASTSSAEPPTASGQSSSVSPALAQEVQPAVKSTPLLREGGNFVAKVLVGEGFEDLQKSLKPHFRKFQCYRTSATRQESKEMYIIGIGAVRSN